MSDLERWQELLKQKMAVLDQLWASLDDIWPLVPSAISPQVSDRADNFYQSYWDVFHAAVESKVLEELSKALDEPVNKAAEHVAEAWRTVTFTRVEQLEGRIESARQSGPVQLAEARATLRQAKTYLENGSKEATAGRHPQAINLFKQCITYCDAGVDRVDDALRIMQSAIQEANRRERAQEMTIIVSRKQVTIGLISLIATILIAIVGWFITLQYLLPSP